MATSSAFRPAVGIERLPVSAAARRLSNEPRESMNCKSCRKRKIKCNRLRPTYAVPKKRGPKTDVLEALLKRVDGLERRLKDEKQLNSSKDSPSDPPSVPPDTSSSAGTDTFPDHAPQQRPNLKTENIPEPTTESAIYTPTPSVQSPAVADDVLLDAYFGRAHGKPYFLLDEGVIRSRAQAGTAPTGLLLALYAVGARYAVHPNGGQHRRAEHRDAAGAAAALSVVYRAGEREEGVYASWIGNRDGDGPRAAPRGGSAAETVVGRAQPAAAPVLVVLPDGPVRVVRVQEAVHDPG
ncbi:hypothetical protein V498_09556 [Pseudogymnoascus sp. VKM F-4517 (FW-2822)]|nr:hypothetical protein V498_09556 [Pseudogymnoascus sp. VKM F-4517 (FW-2822)]